MHIEDQNQAGMFIYSNNRLIKMHEKVGPQLKMKSLWVNFFLESKAAQGAHSSFLSVVLDSSQYESCLPLSFPLMQELICLIYNNMRLYADSQRKSHFQKNIVSNAFPYVFQFLISSFQMSNILPIKK